MHAVNSLPGISITAISTRNNKIKKLYANNYKIFDSWHDLCEMRTLDGVIISTPPHTHIDIATFAIKNELSVLIENPLSLDQNEADKFYDYVIKNKAKVIVNFIQTFNPIFIEMKNKIKNIDEIKRIETFAGGWGPFRSDTPPIWDWGCHDIAMCLDIVGKYPKKINKRILKSLDNSKFDNLHKPQNVEIHLGFDNKLDAFLRIGNLFDVKSRNMRVICKDYIIEFDDIKKRLFIDKNNKKKLIENTFMKDFTPLEYLIVEFARQIKSKVVKNDNIKLAIEVTRILSAI